MDILIENNGYSTSFQQVAYKFRQVRGTETSHELPRLYALLDNAKANNPRNPYTNPTDIVC